MVSYLKSLIKKMASRVLRTELLESYITQSNLRHRNSLASWELRSVRATLARAQQDLQHTRLWTADAFRARAVAILNEPRLADYHDTAKFMVAATCPTVNKRAAGHPVHPSARWQVPVQFFPDHPLCIPGHPIPALLRAAA